MKRSIDSADEEPHRNNKHQKVTPHPHPFMAYLMHLDDVSKIRALESSAHLCVIRDRILLLKASISDHSIPLTDSTASKKQMVDMRKSFHEARAYLASYTAKLKQEDPGNEDWVDDWCRRPENRALLPRIRTPSPVVGDEERMTALIGTTCRRHGREQLTQQSSESGPDETADTADDPMPIRKSDERAESPPIAESEAERVMPARNLNESPSADQIADSPPIAESEAEREMSVGRLECVNSTPEMSEFESEFEEIKIHESTLSEGDAKRCVSLSLALWELIADNQNPLLKKTATDGKTFQAHLLNCLKIEVERVLANQRILDTHEKYDRTTYDQKRTMRDTLRHFKESLNEAMLMATTDAVPVIVLPKDQREIGFLKDLFLAFCVDEDGRERFGSATEAIRTFLSRKEVLNRKKGKHIMQAKHDRFYVVGPFRYGEGSVVVSPSSYVWTELVTTWNATGNRLPGLKAPEAPDAPDPQISDEEWVESLSRLEAYRDQFGDCNVPINWNDGAHTSSLGRWVADQIRQIRIYIDNPTSSTMTEARLDDLHRVGAIFHWNLGL